MILLKCCISFGLMGLQWQPRSSFSQSGCFMHLEWDICLLIIKNQQVFSSVLRTVTFLNFCCTSTEIQRRGHPTSRTTTMKISLIFLRSVGRPSDWLLKNFGKARRILSFDWTAANTLKNLSSRSGSWKKCKRVNPKRVMTSLLIKSSDQWSTTTRKRIERISKQLSQQFYV